MSGNVLDPSALISLLPTLLPPSSKTLASSQDGIAALLHSAMCAVGFRVIAVDESSPGNAMLANVLPIEWNRHGPGHYTFRYRHDHSSLEFVLNVTKLGGRTLINAIAVESDKVAALDISTNDFISPSFFPHDLNAGSIEQPLVHGFISSNRITDLMSQFQLKIVQKLIPSLRKPGYIEETTDASTNPSGSDSQVHEHLPARPRPQAPHAPANVHHPPPLFPPENPLEIGRRDLDPFPSNLFTPPPLFPSSGDGMFVGPDHPIFGSGRGRNSFGAPGPWGGDGFLPPMGAPPGARFDPVGPGPFPGRGGFGRGRGGPGGNNLRDPDNDEFMPPGAGDMYM